MNVMACGLLFGYLVSGLTFESSGVATVVACDCSDIPAATQPMVLTLTGHCDGENFTRENVLAGVVLPKAELAWTFQDLPTDRHCYFRVPDIAVAGRTYNGRNLFVGATTLPTEPAPTPDPSPTPSPSTVPQNPLVITSPAANTTVSGRVPVVVTVPTGSTPTLSVRAFNAAGVVVADSGHVTAPGDQPSMTVSLDFSTVPQGPYVLRAFFSTMTSADVPVTVGLGTQTPPPPQTPSPDLNVLTLKLDQIISLLQQPPLPPQPQTADCPVTAVNSASVTIRCTRANFPAATVGQSMKVIK